MLLRENDVKGNSALIVGFPFLRKTAVHYLKEGYIGASISFLKRGPIICEKLC